MRSTERQITTPRPAPADPGSAGDGMDLDAMWGEAREIASAGTNAIRRALSGDPEKFLREVLQQGGE